MNPTDLIQLRQKWGLRQAEFWGRIGVTQSAGSRYEKGPRVPPKPVAMLVAITYGSARDRQRVLDSLNP